MNRKFQVFISSTFKDLKTERQAAVEAVLDAGHIPAGMELFTASDQSQLEVIKRWIDESDVFMLILGVRYGSLEPVSKRSYTRCEYEYALERGKPVFAVYLSQAEYDKRLPGLVKDIEGEDRAGYNEFRAAVKGRLCSEFQDERDIKLAVHKTLKDFERKPELQKAGWVRNQDVPDHTEALGKIAQLSSKIVDLTSENARLTAEVSSLSKAAAGQSGASEERFGRYSFKELCTILYSTKFDSDPSDLFDLFVLNADRFVMGIADPKYDMHGEMLHSSKWLYQNAAPKLIALGLLQKGKVGDAPFGVVCTPEGEAFLAKVSLEVAMGRKPLSPSRLDERPPAAPLVEPGGDAGVAGREPHDVHLEGDAAARRQLEHPEQAGRVSLAKTGSGEPAGAGHAPLFGQPRRQLLRKRKARAAGVGGAVTEPECCLAERPGW